MATRKSIGLKQSAKAEMLESYNESELTLREIDGERKLNKQMVLSLETKIKEQQEQIRQLTQKANEAGLQIQSIAVKAIEGASGQRLAFTSGGGLSKDAETLRKD
jgi:hypothetical protein